MEIKGLCNYEDADASDLDLILTAVARNATVNVIENKGSERRTVHGREIAKLFYAGYEFFYTYVGHMRIFYLRKPKKT